MEPAESLKLAALSERGICTQFITPAIQAADWNTHSQMREEGSLSAGCVIVRSNRATRNKITICRAGYVLYYEPGMPLAVVEAKDATYSVRDGIQQALDYAVMLDIPFAFSSNGSGFVFYDKTLTTPILGQKIGMGACRSHTKLTHEPLNHAGTK